MVFYIYLTFTKPDPESDMSISLPTSFECLSILAPLPSLTCEKDSDTAQAGFNISFSCLQSARITGVGLPGLTSHLS